MAQRNRSKIAKAIGTDIDHGHAVLHVTCVLPVTTTLNAGPHATTAALTAVSAGTVWGVPRRSKSSRPSCKTTRIRWDKYQEKKTTRIRQGNGQDGTG
eukprot:1731814-Rhodomonas_salina.3